MMNSSLPKPPSDAVDLAQEVTAVARAAAAGDLEPRVLHIPDRDPLSELALAVNAMLDTVDAYVREAGATLSAASERRFYRRFMLRGMPGTFRRGAETITHASGVLAQQQAQIEQSHQRRERVISDLQAVLESNAERIAGIADTIGKFAAGTRMLGLNARIEAARAGEAGAGFAVVADEVQGISERIAKAADEIATELKAFREESQRVFTDVRQDYQGEERRSGLDRRRAA